MAVNLNKPLCTDTISPMHETTPVHLLDEEETMSHISSESHQTKTTGILEREMQNKKSMGVLERECALANAIKEMDTKIGQAAIFKTKCDLKLMHESDILEKGHRIRFIPPYGGDYWLSERNMTIARTGIYVLLNNCLYNIQFDYSKFDDYFEPDFELSRLYSMNSVKRWFKRKEIKAYLENTKQEILQNRKTS